MRTIDIETRSITRWRWIVCKAPTAPCAQLTLHKLVAVFTMASPSWALSGNGIRFVRRILFFFEMKVVKGVSRGQKRRRMTFQYDGLRVDARPSRAGN